MKLFKRLKRGVKAGMEAIRLPQSMPEQIQRRYTAFMGGKQRQLMITGEKYYLVDNDINTEKKDYHIDKKTGSPVPNINQANNKLAHAMYKNMVDEKVSYLFTKEYTLSCDDTEYLSKVQKQLGERFKYKLSLLGYEASNKGIGWLHPYIAPDGTFKLQVVSCEQIIPIWTDGEHEELEAAIYFYDEEYTDNGNQKIRQHIEYWTAEGVTCYIQQDKELYLDYKGNHDADDRTVSHFIDHGEWCSWGKVPFIPFKNNFIEMPDIKFVKSLIDGYDKARSEAADYVEDVRNLLYVVKGYKPDSESVIREKIKNRILQLDGDDDEDSGLEAISANTDITAIKEHCEQLKRDIIEAGQGVIKDLDKFGNSPSGVALSFMYMSLDLKAGAMSTQFTFGFEELIYFVNRYLDMNESPADIKFTLNTDMKINQTENLQNCQIAKNLGLSDDTWLSKCSWVDDVEKEKGALRDNMPFKDKVPGIDDGEE